MNMENGKTEIMQRYCDELNRIIADKKDGFKDMLNEVMAKVYADNGCLYWHRDVFISCNGDETKMKMLVTDTNSVHFEVSNDPDEHPGVTVHYDEPLNL